MILLRRCEAEHVASRSDRIAQAKNAPSMQAKASWAKGSGLCMQRLRWQHRMLSAIKARVAALPLVPRGNLKSANSATRANWSYRQATTVRHPHYLPRVDGIVYGGMIGTRRLCIAYCSSTLYIRLLRSVRESAATFAVSATDQVVGEGDQGGVLVEKLMGKNRGFALAGAFEAFTYQIEIWEARATSMPDSMWDNWISSRWTRRSATRALTWRTSR
jgi:hypothetical protein